MPIGWSGNPRKKYVKNMHLTWYFGHWNKYFLKKNLLLMVSWSLINYSKKYVWWSVESLKILLFLISSYRVLGFWQYTKNTTWLRVKKSEFDEMKLLAKMLLRSPHLMMHWFLKIIPSKILDHWIESLWINTSEKLMSGSRETIL